MIEIKAIVPRNELFVATAVDERPGLASTRYASVLAYIHLEVDVRVTMTICKCYTDVEENPASTSVMQMVATFICFWHTQA